MYNISKFTGQIEKLNTLIADHDSNVGTANSMLERAGVLEGIPNISATAVNAADFNRFTMFIDRWGTSTRKVGQ